MTRPILTLLASIILMPLSLPSQALPAGLVERELAVTGGPLQLLGTLTLPPGNGPFPAAIIVHGSGPADRDLTLGPNHPYRDLAWGLAQRGLAVYRYDKRSVVKPSWFERKVFTVKDEVVDDAVNALQLLRRQPEIDTTRLIVIGHSLGGILAPRIATADGGVAALVLMAGATRARLPDQVERQMAYLESLGGPNAASIKSQEKTIKELLSQIRALGPQDAGLTGQLMGAPPAYYLDLAAYDPVATTRALNLPVLALQGERDYQVTTEELTDWLKAFASDSLQPVVRRYPTLNHLFLPGVGKPNPEEYGRPGRVPDEVYNDIANFVAGWSRNLRR